MISIRTDKQIIKILIFYVILLFVPIVIPQLYQIFSAYFTTVLLFSVMLLRHYKDNISLKKITAILILLLLQYVALMTSGLLLEKESVILPLMYAINIVSLFCMTENIKIDKDDLLKFYKFYLYLSIGFCIYNFVDNFETISNLLNIGGSLEGLMIASAFRNRNVFGFTLIWAIISGVYIYARTRKKRYIFYLLFILLNMVITFSRNSLMTTALFILFFSWLFFKEQRQKVIYGLVAAVTAIYLIMTNKSINGLIVNAVIRAGSGLSDREIAWNYFFENMDVREYIIGSGVGSSQEILKSIDFYSFHNSFLDLVSTGGLISLIIYIIAIIYLIVYYYQALNKHPLEASIFVAGIVSFQFYCIFESIVLQIGIGLTDVLVALFLYLLPLLFLKEAHAPADNHIKSNAPQANLIK